MLVVYNKKIFQGLQLGLCEFLSPIRWYADAKLSKQLIPQGLCYKELLDLLGLQQETEIMLPPFLQNINCFNTVFSLALSFTDELASSQNWC